MRQFLSSERSLSVGTILCYRFSRPITLLRSFKRLKRLSRTSLDSSRSRTRKMGKMYSLVGPFSITGQIDSRFSARACRTYANWSFYSLFKLGITFYISVFWSKIVPKSESLLTAAVRTSLSVSSRNWQ